ncbi:MAG: hypothetical protein ABR498_04055 [Candidatus Dormibacteria bacterium]
MRRNSNGTYYATLDGLTKYTTVIAFPAAMEPGVVAEANRPCAYTYTDAQAKDGSIRTLRWHDNARSWQLWTQQYDTQELVNPELWSIYRPGGSGQAYHADGANPRPSNC